MAGTKRKADMAFADNGVVTVKVGSALTPFIIHRNFLLEKIPHFDKHFGKDAKFKEGKTGVVDLPAVNASTWDLIELWIYRGKLPEIPHPERARGKLISPEDWKSAIRVADAVEEKFHEIISNAETWFCDNLAKDAFEAIRKNHSAMSDRYMSKKLAFDSIINLAPHSGFRKFLLKSICLEFIDLDENARGSFFDALSDNNANEKDTLLIDFCSAMANIAKERAKVTMKMLLDPTKDWYKDALIVHGSDSKQVEREDPRHKGWR